VKPVGMIGAHGTWRSLVSALVWGTRGRRFKSGRPDQMDRILTIPNVLSFLRLASVPVFVWLFAIGETTAAVILYAVGAWTDFFDGWIARRTNSVTELGKLLDPLADRVFIVALVVALVLRDALPVWVAAAIVGRDVLILALYPVVQRGALQKIRVNFVGKTATAALLFGLTSLAINETTVSWHAVLLVPGQIMVAVGVVLYWVSGAMYAREALAMGRKHDEGELVGGR
jgi:cardiolipin synthase (CMP-forming)